MSYVIVDGDEQGTKIIVVLTSVLFTKEKVERASEHVGLNIILIEIVRRENSVSE